jgi:hypothetical protein
VTGKFETCSRDERYNIFLYDGYLKDNSGVFMFVKRYVAFYF